MNRINHARLPGTATGGCRARHKPGPFQTPLMERADRLEDATLLELT
jgi:hypothetical protein